MRKKILFVTLLALTLIGGCQKSETTVNEATPTVQATVAPTKAEEIVATPTVEAVPEETPTITTEPTAEPAITVEPTEVPAVTMEPTATATPEPTATSTPTPEPTVTSTPVPTATSTPTPEPTATPVPTSTPTPSPEPTATPVPTSTPIPELTEAPVSCICNGYENLECHEWYHYFIDEDGSEIQLSEVYFIADDYGSVTPKYVLQTGESDAYGLGFTGYLLFDNKLVNLRWCDNIEYLSDNCMDNVKSSGVSNGVKWEVRNCYDNDDTWYYCVTLEYDSKLSGVVCVKVSDLPVSEDWSFIDVLTVHDIYIW